MTCSQVGPKFRQSLTWTQLGTKRQWLGTRNTKSCFASKPLICIPALPHSATRPPGSSRNEHDHPCKGGRDFLPCPSDCALASGYRLPAALLSLPISWAAGSRQPEVPASRRVLPTPPQSLHHHFHLFFRFGSETQPETRDLTQEFEQGVETWDSSLNVRI